MLTILIDFAGRVLLGLEVLALGVAVVGLYVGIEVLMYRDRQKEAAK